MSNGNWCGGSEREQVPGTLLCKARAHSWGFWTGDVSPLSSEFDINHNVHSISLPLIHQREPSAGCGTGDRFASLLGLLRMCIVVVPASMAVMVPCLVRHLSRDQRRTVIRRQTPISGSRLLSWINQLQLAKGQPIQPSFPSINIRMVQISDLTGVLSSHSAMSSNTKPIIGYEMYFYSDLAIILQHLRSTGRLLPYGGSLLQLFVHCRSRVADYDLEIMIPQMAAASRTGVSLLKASGASSPLSSWTAVFPSLDNVMCTMQVRWRAQGWRSTPTARSRTLIFGRTSSRRCSRLRSATLKLSSAKFRASKGRASLGREIPTSELPGSSTRSYNVKISYYPSYILPSSECHLSYPLASNFLSSIRRPPLCCQVGPLAEMAGPCTCMKRIPRRCSPSPEYFAALRSYCGIRCPFMCLFPHTYLEGGLKRSANVRRWYDFVLS
jgi:hypothetical protein